MGYLSEEMKQILELLDHEVVDGTVVALSGDADQFHSMKQRASHFAHAGVLVLRCLGLGIPLIVLHRTKIPSGL